jgi:hypothetical protein
MAAAEDEPPAWETEQDAIETYLNFPVILGMCINIFTYFAQK